MKEALRSREEGRQLRLREGGHWGAMGADSLGVGQTTCSRLTASRFSEVGDRDIFQAWSLGTGEGLKQLLWYVGRREKCPETAGQCGGVRASSAVPPGCDGGACLLEGRQQSPVLNCFRMK